jgi:transmembrane sensor
MENEQEHLQGLFLKYLDNNINTDELEMFWQLLERGATGQVLNKELRALWEASAQSTAAFSEQEWDHKLEQMKISVSSEKTPLVAVRTNRRVYLRIAAAVFLLLGSGLLALTWLRQGSSRSAALSQQEAPGYTGHQVINLPDGSRVILNVGSKLHYPSRFSESTREVYLTGEAYFDIKSIASQPFLVHTGTITTRVLGTSFNVKAYPGDPNITVAVTSGKVQVSTKEKDMGVVLPDEQVNFDKQENAFTKIKTNLTPVIAWKEEDLVLDSVTLGEAAVIIGNKYHVEIHFAREELKQCRLTATFFSQHGIDHVLTVLCKLSNVAFRKEGEVIFIDGAGCN